MNKEIYNEVNIDGKKEKKKPDKAFIKWILLLIVGFVVGVVIGVFGFPLVEYFKNFTFDVKVFAWPLSILTLSIFLISNVVAIGIGIYFYKKCKKMADTWDGEDEEVIDKIEDQLDWAIIPNSVVQQCNFFFFALVTYISFNYGTELEDLALICTCFLGVVIFLGAMLAGVALQKKAIDLEMKLNPEKRGNIFDKNFAKEWEASCDEAEKARIYKAGYQAYKTAIYTCYGLWLVTVLAMEFFSTGIFPVLIITILMVATTISYCAEARKENKSK